MLLPYQVFNNPANIQAVMNNIRNFAVSAGWTQEDWQTDVTWTPTTGGWQADVGNGDYLQLQSTLHGSQNYRIALQHHRSHIAVNPRTQNSYSNSDPRPIVQNIAYNRGHLTPNAGSANDYVFQSRYAQNEWDTDWGWALKEGSMTKQWVFGNDLYIASVVTVDGIYYTMLHFGTFPGALGTKNAHLFNAASPTGFNGTFSGYQLLSQSLSPDRKTDWDYHVNQGATVSWAVPHCGGLGYFGQTTSGQIIQYSLCIYYDGREITYNSSRTEVSNFVVYIPNYFPSSQTNHPTIRLPNVVHPPQYCMGGTNTQSGYRALLDMGIISFSGRKPMFKPTFFYQKQSDSLWYPLGKFPYWITNNLGNEPGGEVVIGGKKYITFPCKSFDSKLGYVFRIA